MGSLGIAMPTRKSNEATISFNVTITVSRDQYKEIGTLAIKKDRSFSWLARSAILAMLEADKSNIHGGK